MEKAKHFQYQFSSVDCYFQRSLAPLDELAGKSKVIFLTDENLYGIYKETLQLYPVITISSGEDFKQQRTADYIINQLLEIGATRDDLLIGFGAGVVTDLAGYVASIYKRGMRLGFIPTSLLAMVDASIGGKNGVNHGLYKNMVGTFYQPSFIIFNHHYLSTLPHQEWVNGFAEIIKHACIGDEAMFQLLEEHDITYWKSQPEKLAELIERNACYKFEVTLADEKEKGIRKWLNFGHTIGHAIENRYRLPHGKAISIGMMAAAKLSVELEGLDSQFPDRLKKMLIRYELPDHYPADHNNLIELMAADKKMTYNGIDFILLKEIGNPIIKNIPLDALAEFLKKYFQ
jgi:3-dehydroquinate synthase